MSNPTVSIQRAPEVTPGVACRTCGDRVDEFFDLGQQPLSNHYPLPDRAADVPTYHLSLGLCVGCGMVQQTHPARPDQMFTASYPYRASGSSKIRVHFSSAAGWIATLLVKDELPRFVAEVGSNDGVLTAALTSHDITHVGIDPSVDAAEEARAKGTNVVTECFTRDIATQLADERGQAGVIFSANTVSHINDLGEVMEACQALLHPRGWLVLEDRWLKPIVEANEFDQAYDEHIYLFGARSVRALLRRFGFELCAVEYLPVHGGSLRYAARRTGVATEQSSVSDFLSQEARSGLDQPETLARFARRSLRIGQTLGRLVEALAASGASIDGYAATSRSATAMSLSGVAPSLGAIYDSTPGKQGRVTPLTGVPIVTPEAFSDRKPDFALLFAWNHADEIRAKESWYADQGGRWILYQPEVRIL